MKPNLIFTPLRSAITRKDEYLTGLLHIVAPHFEMTKVRRNLNICFCVDVSGSMDNTVEQHTKEITPGYWRQQPIPQPWNPWPGRIHPPIFMGNAGNQVGVPLNSVGEMRCEGVAGVVPYDPPVVGYEWVWVQPTYITTKVTKLQRVVDSAVHALDLLGDNDILSIVAFESSSSVRMVPMRMNAANKEHARRVLKGLRTAGSTALYAGWKQAAEQVCINLHNDYVNRVLMLTDGEATDAAKNIDFTAGEVAKMIEHQITTSTMGVGREFNETLLQSMSDAGDGRYFYLENAESMHLAFEQEIYGASRVYGNRVVLSLNSVGDGEVLNGFDKTDGGWKLPSATMGKDEFIVIKIKNPLAKGDKTARASLRYSWKNKDGLDQYEDIAIEVPVVSAEKAKSLVDNEVVAKKVLEMDIAKAKREAMAALDRKDYTASAAILNSTQTMISGSAYAASFSGESSRITAMASVGSNGDYKGLRKMAHFDSLCARDSYVDKK